VSFLLFTVAYAQEATATLDGASLELGLAGQTYVLSDSAVVPGHSVEIHWQQPLGEGYNQLWLILGKTKPGRDVTLDGPGMYVTFLQIQTSSEEVATRNVSAFCSTHGTARLDDKPKSGATVGGAVDVTITCRDVLEIPAPLVVKGTFSGIPVR
jgi:hypothetical protein